jgi:hypothetical protein
MTRPGVEIPPAWSIRVKAHTLDRWDIPEHTATIPAIDHGDAIDLAIKGAHIEAEAPPWKPLQRRSIPFARAERAASWRRDIEEEAPVLISDYRREDDPAPALALFPADAYRSPVTPAWKAA